jgi:EmrB/QacA subfamily drug resistance transporter
MAKTDPLSRLETQKWPVFLMVAVGIFMATLDGSIVNIALPAVMADFGVPLAAVQWVVMIYLLTVTSLLLSFGRLSDILGRRVIYSLGLLLFSLGSLFCGMASSALWLIISRFFQGLGAAMTMACTPALIVDTFPETERGRALGFMGSVVASGLTAGPVLGGLLIHYFSWRAIFYINIPIGLLTAAGVFFLLKGSRADITRPEETFDWAGAAFLAFVLGTFLVAVTHAYQWGYFSAPILLLLAASILAGACLLFIETKVRHPVLARPLFGVRLFALPIAAAVILFICLFFIVFLMPFYLLHPCGYQINAAGGIMACIFFALFVVSPLSGALSDRIGSRLLCTLAMGFIAAALFSLALIPPRASLFSILWRLVLAGTGTAMFLPPNSAVAFSAVPPASRGVASATIAAARNLGMVLGVALAGAIFNSAFYRMSNGLSLKEYSPALEAMFMASFHLVMAAGGCIALIGMLVSFLRGPEQPGNRGIKPSAA